MASPTKAVGRGCRGHTSVFTIVETCSVMAPENFAKHGREETRCTLDCFGKSERGQKKTNEVPRLARENISVEVHYVVGQGAADDRVDALVIQPRSTISAHISMSLGLVCRFIGQALRFMLDSGQLCPTSLASDLNEIHWVLRDTYAEPIVSMARANIITSWSRPWSILACLGALKDLAFSHLFMACKYASASRQKQRSPELVSSRSGSVANARALKAFNRSLNLLEPLAYREHAISETSSVMIHMGFKT